ncbi:MAG: molybdenum cofactor biosynthesis protein MoaE [Bacteroidia bacterium]|jgi:molybdopterin synthase catalytic subunit|nr:molybdenum cofactor biosynthesis protein MoaE [Bacteroidia bacterium]
MEDKNWYNFKFADGAITAEEIALSIKPQGTDKAAGAYAIFLGQVRQDTIEGKNVHAITYSSNEEMARQAFLQIANDARAKFEVRSLSIIHSKEEVKGGELCLMVLVTCGHRKESFMACEYIVERLKKEVPIWGKEILEDETHLWKINK